MLILNLTQHLATPDQIAAGVVDLLPEARECLTTLLTFSSVPTRAEVNERARDIAELAQFAQQGAFVRADDDDRTPDRAMIGGAPFLMSALESALLDQSINPLYAFSERVSAEEKQLDGSVRKINVFRHAGFVPAK